jgi:hypothetical protein
VLGVRKNVSGRQKNFVLGDKAPTKLGIGGVGSFEIQTKNL